MLSLNSCKLTDTALVATEAKILWEQATKAPMPNICLDTMVAYATNRISSIQEMDKISTTLVDHLMAHGYDVEAAEDVVMSMKVDGTKERAALRIKAQQQLCK